MSKQHNIRWKQSDLDELRRTVKNFNAKITRLEKKNPENKNALPSKVTVKQMRELISTRQDLKRELNALKRFSKRGAEEIVVIPETQYKLKTTKWQKTEMNRRIGLINRKRKQKLKEISNIEMTDRGEAVGYRRGDIGMGTMEENQFKPMVAFTRAMNYKELKMKFDNIMRESQTTYWNKRDEVLRRNYINAILHEYNINDVKEIIEHIENMDFQEFRKVFEADAMKFEGFYRPNDEEYNAYLEALRSTWMPNKKG